jgi:hypothetical protein
MRTRRILTRGPAGEPQWACLDVRALGAAWAALIVADGESPPEPGSLKGMAFVADTAAEAERLAIACLGKGVAQN